MAGTLGLYADKAFLFGKKTQGDVRRRKCTGTRGLDLFDSRVFFALSELFLYSGLEVSVIQWFPFLAERDEVGTPFGVMYVSLLWTPHSPHRWPPPCPTLHWHVTDGRECSAFTLTKRICLPNPEAIFGLIRIIEDWRPTLSGWMSIHCMKRAKPRLFMFIARFTNFAFLHAPGPGTMFRVFTFCVLMGIFRLRAAKQSSLCELRVHCRRGRCCRHCVCCPHHLLCQTPPNCTHMLTTG